MRCVKKNLMFHIIIKKSSIIYLFFFFYIIGNWYLLKFELNTKNKKTAAFFFNIYFEFYFFNFSQLILLNYM
jgi:hypothetical protein